MDTPSGAPVTVGIVYRVPGHGAVLGCDSRTCMSDGSIITDHDEKWSIFGTVIACVAGEVGGLWMDLIDTPPTTWPAFRKAFTDPLADAQERTFELLAYDRRADVLWHTDHRGEALKRGMYATIGCGGPYAQGVLDASGPPKTLDAAGRLVRRALAITCRRHSACGGRLRTVTIPRRGAPTVR